MPFRFQHLKIPDVILIESRIFHDNRGFFIENYKRSDFLKNGITEYFVQDNVSRSAKNVLRGLHFQIPPFAQGKLVMVSCGEIFDVAVDIRSRSSTFGKWISEHLSEHNGHMLYIPPGFAHGFCVLSEQATVMYKCTAEYAPQHDRGILWNDPDIGIDWPITHPIVSQKDADLPMLANVENLF